MSPRIGEPRRIVRERVEHLVDIARTQHWSAVRLRDHLNAVWKHDATRGSRARRVWLEELRRAKAPIRHLPDFRQMLLSFGPLASA